jgi:hypothetical protein
MLDGLSVSRTPSCRLNYAPTPRTGAIHRRVILDLAIRSIVGQGIDELDPLPLALGRVRRHDQVHV